MNSKRSEAHQQRIAQRYIIQNAMETYKNKQNCILDNLLLLITGVGF